METRETRVRIMLSEISTLERLLKMAKEAKHYTKIAELYGRLAMAYGQLSVVEGGTD